MSQQERLPLTPPDRAEAVHWVRNVLSPAVCCVLRAWRTTPKVSPHLLPWGPVRPPPQGAIMVGGMKTHGSFLLASLSSVRWEARFPAESDDGEGGVEVWRLEEKV